MKHKIQAETKNGFRNLLSIQKLYHFNSVISIRPDFCKFVFFIFNSSGMMKWYVVELQSYAAVPARRADAL